MPVLSSDTFERTEIDNTALKNLTEDILHIDERKVKNYKDDIDTLLLVAGLFAAVLTPLLVESYQELRQDPTDTVVALLQQIATQGNPSVMDHSNLNSTSRLSNDNQNLAFAPTVNAKRVNALWFASLVLSLATASFGLTVKQWLREYLAGEYISPLIQLRIRNFRYTDMLRWHVFTIAALLPLLLQIALALFFTGLYFFTEDLHQPVGHTTLAFIVAWACPYVISILMPLYDQRCPYKNPFLRVSRMGIGLRILWRKLCRKGHSSNELYLSAEQQAAHNETSDFENFLAMDRFQGDDDVLTEKLWRALISIPAKRDPADLIQFIIAAVCYRLDCTKDELFSRPVIKLSRLPKQTYTKIMGVVASIIGVGLGLGPYSSSKGDFSEKPWLDDCLVFLLSEAGSLTVPPTASDALKDCLRGNRRSDVLALIHSRVDWRTDNRFFLIILQKLRDALALVDNTAELVGIVSDLFPQSQTDSLPSTAIPLLPPPETSTSCRTTADDWSIVSSDTTRQHRRPKSFTNPSSSNPYEVRILPEYQQSVLHLFIGRVGSVQGRGTWGSDDLELLTCILRFPAPETQHLACKLVHSLLLSSKESDTTAFYHAFQDTGSTLGSADTARSIYRDVFLSAQENDRTCILFHVLLWISARSTLAIQPELLHRFADFRFSDRSEGTRQQTTQYSALDLCACHLNLVQTVITQGNGVLNEPHRLLWNLLFLQFDYQLRHSRTYVDPFNVLKANECIQLMEAIKKTYSKHSSIFQDSLASKTLMRIAMSLSPPKSQATDGPEDVPPTTDNPLLGRIMKLDIPPPSSSGLNSGRMERSSSQQSQSSMLRNRETPRRSKAWDSLTTLGSRLSESFRLSSMSIPPSPTTPQDKHAQGSRHGLPSHSDSRSFIRGAAQDREMGHASTSDNNTSDTKNPTVSSRAIAGIPTPIPENTASDHESALARYNNLEEEEEDAASNVIGSSSGATAPLGTSAEIGRGKYELDMPRTYPPNAMMRLPSLRVDSEPENIIVLDADIRSPVPQTREANSAERPITPEVDDIAQYQRPGSAFPPRHGSSSLYPSTGVRIAGLQQGTMRRETPPNQKAENIGYYSHRLPNTNAGLTPATSNQTIVATSSMASLERNDSAPLVRVQKDNASNTYGETHGPEEGTTLSSTGSNETKQRLKDHTAIKLIGRRGTFP